MSESLKPAEQQFLEFALEAADRTETWADLQNALFGVGAIFPTLYPTIEQRTKAFQTPEVKQIQQILVDRLGKETGTSRPNASDGASFSGKLNLRMPVSMHAALAAEAEEEGVSMNTLILSKIATQLRAVVQPHTSNQSVN